MAQSSLLGQIVVAVSSFIIGAWTHELWHWLFGRLAGGETFLSGWHFYPVIPGEVDFEQPHAMSNIGVRLAAAGGPIALLLLFIFLIGTSGSNNSYLQLHHLGPIVFLAAVGFPTSWLDLFAVQDPNKWKRFTAGEAIRRDDFE